MSSPLRLRSPSYRMVRLLPNHHLPKNTPALLSAYRIACGFAAMLWLWFVVSLVMTHGQRIRLLAVRGYFRFTRGGTVTKLPFCLDGRSLSIANTKTRWWRR